MPGLVPGIHVVPCSTPVKTRMAGTSPAMTKKSDAWLVRIWRREQIAEAAHGLDHVDAELLADASDKDLDGIGVAVEILVVQMLDQFRARDYAAGMVHEIGEQAIFVAGELDRIAVDRDAIGAGVEANRSAIELALGMAGGAAQQGTQPRQHLFEMERFCHVVVGAGVKALDLVAPAVARGENEHWHHAAAAPPGL